MSLLFPSRIEKLKNKSFRYCKDETPLNSDIAMSCTLFCPYSVQKLTVKRRRSKTARYIRAKKPIDVLELAEKCVHVAAYGEQEFLESNERTVGRFKRRVGYCSRQRELLSKLGRKQN